MNFSLTADVIVWYDDRFGCPPHRWDNYIAKLKIYLKPNSLKVIINLKLLVNEEVVQNHIEMESLDAETNI